MGVTLAVVMHLTPPRDRPTAAAIFFLVISNLGGNANVLVTPIQRHLSLSHTLLVLFPGMYLLGGLGFAALLYRCMKAGLFLRMLNLHRCSSSRNRGRGEAEVAGE